MLREQLAEQPVFTRIRRAPAPRPAEKDDLDEIEYYPRSPSSVIDYRKHPIETQVRVRYQTVERAHVTQQGKRQIAAPKPVMQQGVPAPRSQGRLTKFLLVGTCILLALWIGATLLNMVGAWWQVSQDDAHYGRPRTFQVDQVVGHNDDAQHPSHFIAINLHLQVQVIEWPGGDPAKVKTYLALLLAPSQELAPVTLAFRDVNGDGKPDMIVSTINIRVVFINENGTFRPRHEGEPVNVS